MTARAAAAACSPPRALLGQTPGSALVALVFGITHGGENAVELGTKSAIAMAAAFAGIAMILSSLRVRQPQGV